MLDTGEDLGGVPKKPTGWSIIGELSVSATNFVPVPPPDKQVALQQVFDKAGAYTVQFDVQPPTPAPTRQPRCTARIDWSVAGNTITRFVDVANGVSISGIAEGVVVTVVDTTPFRNLSAAFDYTVKISVAPGTRPYNPGVPLSPDSVYTGGVAFGAPVTMQIPQNRGINCFAIIPGDFIVGGVQTAYGYANGSFYVRDGAGNILINPHPLGGEIQWIPLPPGAVDILATIFIAGSLNFSILYGVDG